MDSLSGGIKERLKFKKGNPVVGADVDNALIMEQRGTVSQAYHPQVTAPHSPKHLANSLRTFTL